MDPEIHRILELIQQAYGYLFYHASLKGHWNEARSTALAGMSLGLWHPPDSAWVECVKCSNRETQIAEGPARGSWCEEIWDTAMCVLALKELGVSSRDATVACALEWIASLYAKSGHPNWHGEPWETSWSLLAILRSGRVPESVDVAATMNWLVSLQGKDGQIVSPHYTAYFLLIELSCSKARAAGEQRDNVVSAKASAANFLLEGLKKSPSEVLWAGEAWSNGQILWGMAASRVFPLSPSRRPSPSWK